MNTEAYQLIFLGTEIVDKGLTTISESWKNHISTLEEYIRNYGRVKIEIKKEPSPVQITPSPLTPIPPPPPLLQIQQPVDSEWTTDDEESFESMASIGDETYQRMTGKKTPNTSQKLSTIKKQMKRKQTEYFTPSIPHKSTRITRATANRIEVTPKQEPIIKVSSGIKAPSSVSKSANRFLSIEKSSGTTTSGSSIASSVNTISSVGRADSIKGKRTGTRTCTTPDTKTLTASAAKRRLEEEERRKATLAQMKEKEEKAIQSKQENLKMKAQLTKLKNEQKRKKIEQIKKKEEGELKEKRQKEQSKLEEIEKRRKEKEEARRREVIRNQEAAKKREAEFALRKQQEEEERKARILKLEEQNKAKRIESERIRLEQEKIMRMIQQHNSNFQKGQITSSVLPLLQTQPQPQPQPQPTPQPQSQPKVEQPAAAAVLQFKQPLPPTHSETPPALPMNRTFSVDKEAETVKTEVTTPITTPIKVESYELTPSAKPTLTPVNYDISDIKSDDDTDDEEKPKKQIPSWAKGKSLIAALDKQFAKSRRAREREIRQIFPCYDFSIQLTDIFKSSSRVVHPKYDKRTSSAVWSSPPCNSTFNASSMLLDDL